VQEYYEYHHSTTLLGKITALWHTGLLDTLLVVHFLVAMWRYLNDRNQWSRPAVAEVTIIHHFVKWSRQAVRRRWWKEARWSDCHTVAVRIQCLVKHDCGSYTGCFSCVTKCGTGRSVVIAEKRKSLNQLCIFFEWLSKILVPWWTALSILSERSA